MSYEESLTVRVNQRTSSDCLRACLATVTGRPYEEAPDISGDWRAKAIAFLAASSTTGLVIGIGESPRGIKGGHAVVCTPDGAVVHDPHASRDGIVALWELWDAAGHQAELP